MKTTAKYYIYAFIDGCNVLYVGKGSGARLQKQEKRFGIKGTILEWVGSENDAYSREKHWVANLRPTENKDKGGRGGWTKAVDAADLPNGLSPDGLKFAAPYLARLLASWASDNSLTGILSILSSYLKAHGVEAVERAVLPHLRRLRINNLAVENNL